MRKSSGGSPITLSPAERIIRCEWRSTVSRPRARPHSPVNSPQRFSLVDARRSTCRWTGFTTRGHTATARAATPRSATTRTPTTSPRSRGWSSPRWDPVAMVAIRNRVIDLASDQQIDEPPVQAPPDAILIVDGSFLQRGELAGLWDDVVFVDTDF
ncbi:hypothetical protein [Kibdelosporangium philippinense]|uniref:hypothetical protein n=1 Tax=Kibdelosporangium philippinense TaxID=211113 RepID=UPI0036210A92